MLNCVHEKKLTRKKLRFAAEECLIWRVCPEIFNNVIMHERWKDLRNSNRIEGGRRWLDLNFFLKNIENIIVDQKLIIRIHILGNPMQHAFENADYA